MRRFPLRGEVDGREKKRVQRRSSTSSRYRRVRNVSKAESAVHVIISDRILNLARMSGALLQR